MLYELEDFFSDLAQVDIALFPMDARAMGQAGSSLRPVQVGYRLWQGQVTIAPAYHGDARKVEAKLMRLTEVDALFMMSPTHKQKGGGVGTLSSIDALDRRVVTLGGLTVSEGDFIGFTAGGIHCVHSIADVDGSNVHIVPALPLAITQGSLAITSDPKMTCIVMPDAAGRTYRAAIGNAFSFNFSQTLSVVG